ncbi:MAG: hypothetical protein VB934_14135, partial [Polyangiaceae bacterium]
MAGTLLIVEFQPRDRASLRQNERRGDPFGRLLGKLENAIPLSGFLAPLSFEECKCDIVFGVAKHGRLQKPPTDIEVLMPGDPTSAERERDARA